jgi:uncharacterized membrane protein
VKPGAYYDLEARLRRLEAEAARLRRDFEAAGGASAVTADVSPVTGVNPAPGASAPGAAPAPPAALFPGLAAAPKPQARSLETLVAGRGLQLAGLLLVLVGTAYFLELAFSRNWLGPLERVLLGLVAGTALMVVGARRLGTALRYFGEGLIALGAGILYLSLWAALGLFHLVGQAPAFVAMIAVTGALAALAGTRRSERLALMGLFGGFITPLLLASGAVQHLLLGAYLLVLAAAMLALALRAGFRWVESATFVAVLCYAPLFAVDSAHGWNELAAYLAATVVFALFAAAFSLGALRAGSVGRARLALLTVDAACYAGALAAILWTHRTLLGAALIALAAVLLATARAARVPAALRRAYAYLGLAALTLAVPALLHADTLIDAFVVEAALLVVLGTRGADRGLTGAGLVLLGCNCVWLLAVSTFETMVPPLASSLFLAYVIAAGALVVVLRHLREHDDGFYAEHQVIGLVRVVLAVMVWAGLSRQCVDLFDGGKGLDVLSKHAQLALSVLWTAFASVLFGLGMARRDVHLRWQGIVLFGLTVWKVFTVDLAALDSAYRIVSFVGLGVVLVAASAWYQRSFASENGGNAEADA